MSSKKSREKKRTTTQQPPPTLAVDVKEAAHCVGAVVMRTPVHCICVANAFVYVAAWENHVQQYDVKTGKWVRDLEGHTGYVHCMVAVMDSSSLFTGSLDHDVRHFDAKTGSCRQVYSGHSGMVQAVAHREGTVYSGGADCTIRAWDVKKGECLLVFTGHTGYVQCLAFHDAVLYSGSWDSSIRAWDIRTGECKRQFTGHRGWVLSLTLSPSASLTLSPSAWGDRLYSASSQESIVRVWDTKTGECISALEGHEEAIQHVLLSAPESERRKKKAPTETPPPTVTFPPSDLHIGSGDLYTASKDKTIKVWDLLTGECKCTLTGHTAAVHSLQIFERTLVSASLDHSIRLWDLKSIHSQQRKKPTT